MPAMFYEPRRRDHGLPHDPFKALVIPRPIGWISSMSRSGAVNLAPYSFFNALHDGPCLVGFSSAGLKDSAAFIAETGEFVCNLVGEAQWAAMSRTSAPLPRGTSEFAEAGLETAPSRLVAPPRVRDAPAALECRWTETHRLKDAEGRETNAHLVCGEVVGVHIDDRFITGGLVDMAAMRPMARLGYQDYSVLERTLTLARPPGGGDRAGDTATGDRARA